MFRQILERVGILPRASETTPEALAEIEDAPRPAPEEFDTDSERFAERHHDALDLDDRSAHIADDAFGSPEVQSSNIPKVSRGDPASEPESISYNEDEMFSDLADMLDAPAPPVSQDPRDNGNDHTRPKSLEEAKGRYPFIGSIYRKHGMTDESAIDQATLNYADYRRRNRLAYYTEGQVEGWRFASLEQRDHAAIFRGVREDGLLYARTFHERASYDPFKEDATAPIDWSFSDPLGTTKQLAEAVQTGKSPVNARAHHESPRTAFIIQSNDFKQIVEGKRRDIASAVDVEVPYDQEAGARKAITKISFTARQDEIRRFGAMTNALMRSLEPETQKTMRSIGRYEPSTANWLSGIDKGENGPVANPELRRNRVQAVRAYPVFADKIFNSAGIETAICNGEPLAPAFAKALNMKPQSLARMQGVTWQKAGRHHYRNPDRLAKLVNLIDVNHVPTTRAGFAALEVSTEAACVLATNCRKTSLQDAVGSIGGRFEKIADLAEGNPPAGMNDMARNITRQLALPAMVQAAMARGSSREEALDIAAHGEEEFGALEGLSVRNAMQNSARWHRNETVIRQNLNDPDFTNERPWEPLVGEIDLGNGIRAVELCSAQELQNEGNEQDHCVGGYTQEVLNGQSLIFSIRKGDEILSTVEFDNLGNTKIVEDPETGQKIEQRDINEYQNMAFCNEEPGSEATAAAAKLRQHCNALPRERWDEYSDGLDEVRAHSRGDRKLHDVELKASFDPASREKLEASWGMLSQYLPKGERKKGLDAFVQNRIDPLIDRHFYTQERKKARELIDSFQAE
jgi:hypothetical protein